MLSYADAEVSSASQPACRLCFRRGWLRRTEWLLSASCMGWCLQASFKEHAKSTTIAYAGGASGIYLANLFVNRSASRPANKKLLHAAGILSAAGVAWGLHVAFVEHPEVAMKACLAGALSMCLTRPVVKYDPSPPLETTSTESPVETITKSEITSRKIPDVSQSSLLSSTQQANRVKEVGKLLNQMADVFDRRISSSARGCLSRPSPSLRTAPTESPLETIPEESETASRNIPPVHQTASSSSVLNAKLTNRVKKLGKQLNQVAAEIQTRKSSFSLNLSDPAQPSESKIQATPIATPSETILTKWPVETPLVTPEETPLVTPIETPLVTPAETPIKTMQTVWPTRTPEKRETTSRKVSHVSRKYSSSSILSPEQMTWIKDVAKLLKVIAAEMEIRIFSSKKETEEDI